jgi:hypothetical protein
MASTDSLTLRSFDDLRALLERERVKVIAVDASAHAIEVDVRAPPAVGSLAILWEPELQLVQFFHPLPFAIPAERLSAVEHALLRVNDALVMPGFGIRSEHGVVYYRLVVPRREDGSIDAADVQRAVMTVMTTLRDFWRPIQRVIQGEDPDCILAMAREPG